MNWTRTSNSECMNFSVHILYIHNHNNDGGICCCCIWSSFAYQRKNLHTGWLVSCFWWRWWGRFGVLFSFLYFFFGCCKLLIIITVIKYVVIIVTTDDATNFQTHSLKLINIVKKEQIQYHSYQQLAAAAKAIQSDWGCENATTCIIYA